MKRWVLKAKRRSFDLRFFIGSGADSRLADYEQSHEQYGDQNDVRRSVQVVQHAVDFIHGVSPESWCKAWEHCGMVRAKLK